MDKMEERKRSMRTWYGRFVEIVVDRPLGSAHPKHPTLIYERNYGCIKGVLGGDGEEQDVYILDVDAPIVRCRAKIIGAVYRLNDEEDKLLAVADARTGDKKYSRDEISEMLAFQEKFFITEIELAD